jgi:hypothetical protein
MGTNSILGATPELILEIPRLLDRPTRATAIPLWDGSAGERAARVLADFVAGRREP